MFRWKSLGTALFRARRKLQIVQLIPVIYPQLIERKSLSILTPFGADKLNDLPSACSYVSTLNRNLWKLRSPGLLERLPAYVNRKHAIKLAETPAKFFSARKIDDKTTFANTVQNAPYYAPSLIPVPGNQHPSHVNSNHFTNDIFNIPHDHISNFYSSRNY
ncbi:hypothetical protein CDAR_606771 [Caerostris darwini]|uniref:Uncharacterized protein n=1 Tax=Caerostris darwini TaxID=1538125 RepID=A0AAV4U3C4_9ARAC|nr:hypothetical protein CDAR_606771 [Caerostris darwini]